ncbi:hypothetical protein LEN26_006649 [Aphanomyces euteiches]|nr:hypothetical protein LEN26_006649 [Aphanomyces euteiches]
MLEQRDQIVHAVFLILDLNEADDCESFGIGAFFSPTLAVTCDRNLKDEHTVGSLVRVAWRHDMGEVEVLTRNSELDFAILKSSKPRPFLAPWVGSFDDLESIYDVVGAYYQPARDWNKRQVFIGTSFQRVFVLETIPRYDPGTAIIVKDGCLVGIHVELMEAIREGVVLKNATKENSNEEPSLDKLLRSEQFQGRLRLVADEIEEFRGGEQL